VETGTLDEATFDEKLNIVSPLGIKAHPLEDLRLMRIECQLDLQKVRHERTKDTEREAKVGGE
jgi:hypothetical protein